MNRFMLEGLEHRTLLSAVALNVEPMVLTAAPLSAVRVAAKAYNYNCQGQVEGIAGKFVLKLSIAGANVTGSMYSSSWGGFSTSVSGTLSAGKLSLTGKSTTFVLRALKANVSSAGLISAATLAVTQVGMQGTGTFTATKAATVPAPAAAVAPNMVGTYKGTSYDKVSKSTKGITLTITRQSGGLIWGTSNNSTASGFVLANGQVYLMIKNTDGTTYTKGTYVASTGKLTGTWSSGATNGHYGTFTLTRQ
jgi:hypothetical protein